MIRRHIEAALIRLAARILKGRNVQRCRVTSRADNNAMYYMSEKLEDISARVRDSYRVEGGDQ